MMGIKQILGELNIVGQCRKYHVPLHQCPHLLFVVLGTAIGIFSAVSYGISVRYVVDPQVAALGVLGASSLLLVVTFAIVQGFEKVAEASRLKTEFISIVSHQLRTPLTNMRWGLDMVMSGRLDNIALSQKHQEYFQTISQNIGRMNELVQDLLMISRMEQGRLPVHLQLVSMQDFSKEMLAKFRQTADMEGVHLQFSNENEKEPLRAESDPSHLKIVMENLLSNAIRYSRSGGTVELKVARNGNKARVSVRDSGIGIPQKDQKFLFQRFFRAENARTHRPQGTGLGLHITRFLVGSLGGETGFTSQQNKGSTFWFTLPIHKS